MKDLILITESGMPCGFAASNYVKLIAKGLLNAGATIKVLIPWHTEDPMHPLNTETTGTMEGFTFEYTTGTPIRPNSPLERIKRIFQANISTYHSLSKLKSENKLDVILYYGNHLENLIIYSIISCILNVPFISFLVEWHPAIPQKNHCRRLYDHLFNYLVLHTPNAVVLISHFLEQKAKNIRPFLFPLPEIFKMPILVDPEIWNNVSPHKQEHPYVLYCANLDGYFDDACFVIQAMSLLAEPDIDLMFIGQASQETRKRLHAISQQTALQSQLIIHTGYIPEKDLREFYKGSRALLAPLRRDIRSMARFPSKIADYLMAARPVVSCSVGEVAEYLCDRESAYLCEQDDAAAFAESLRLALTDEARENVAENGSLLAQRCFDYRIQGRRFLDFIHSL